MQRLKPAMIRQVIFRPEAVEDVVKADGLV
jgi:hypothetical protein